MFKKEPGAQEYLTAIEIWELDTCTNASKSPELIHRIITVDAYIHCKLFKKVRGLLEKS